MSPSRVTRIKCSYSSSSLHKSLLSLDLEITSVFVCVCVCVSKCTFVFVCELLPTRKTQNERPLQMYVRDGMVNAVVYITLYKCTIRRITPHYSASQFP